jgi:iron(III) transport system permease protein
VGRGWVFTFALYPYVYLLARTALGERAAHLMEAARLLGAPLRRRMREVALPLARPAVAAGVALALMETLADFGVSSYFGIQTFHRRHLQGLVVDGQPRGRRAIGHHVAGAGGACSCFWSIGRNTACVLPAPSGGAPGWMRRPVALLGRARLLAWLVCGVRRC